MILMTCEQNIVNVLISSHPFPVRTKKCGGCYDSVVVSYVLIYLLTLLWVSDLSIPLKMFVIFLRYSCFCVIRGWHTRCKTARDPEPQLRSQVT